MHLTDVISQSSGQPHAVGAARRARWWLVVSLVVLFISTPADDCGGRSSAAD